MSDMKCPFCKEEIISDLCLLCDKKDKDYTSGRQIYKCNKCGLFGTKELWQELIRTRKALDVAVDALNKINMRCQNTVRNHLERATIRGELCDISFYARKAIDDIDNLEQITALEQKDLK